MCLESVWCSILERTVLEPTQHDGEQVLHVLALWRSMSIYRSAVTVHAVLHCHDLTHHNRKRHPGIVIIVLNKYGHLSTSKGGLM